MMVYMVQYDCTHGKFNSIVKAEKVSLSPMESPSPSSRSKILPTLDQVMLVLNIVGSPRCLHYGEARVHSKGGAKVFLSTPSADAPKMSIAGCSAVISMKHEKYDNSLKIVSNVSCTTLGSLGQGHG